MTRIIGLILMLSGVAGHAQIADSSRREVKLQGVVNFRDLGGYPTKDGKHVKWGKLYRSAELSHLTPGGLDTLRALSIAYIADFRGPAEVQSAPDKIPAAVTRVSLSAGSEHTGDTAYMRSFLQSAKDSSGLVPFYSNTSSFEARYKPLFNELLTVSKDSAVLFHCSAGKDRTGIAAALILYALNVEEQSIIQDYLASDYYRRNENEKSIKAMMKAYQLDEATARNLMSVKKIYIQSTFDAIAREYGSVDNFLNRVMGLNAEKLALLRQRYAE